MGRRVDPFAYYVGELRNYNQSNGSIGAVIRHAGLAVDQQFSGVDGGLRERTGELRTRPNKPIGPEMRPRGETGARYVADNLVGFSEE